jgi:hypothetical protein
MNTRHTLQLTDSSITDLQLSPKRRKQAKVKDESSSSPTPSPSFTSNQTHPTSQLLPIMSEADDIIELKEIQRQVLQLENKILTKIPVFKSPHESNVDEFLSTAEEVFTTLDYPDDIRILKINTKLDNSLQSWFTSFKQHGHVTWNDFKTELPNCLQSSSLFTEPINEDKLNDFRVHQSNDSNDKPSLLDLLRHHVATFSGEGNGRQWFLQIDSKFSEFDLTFHDRLAILPYFFSGDAMLWFSSNKNKIQCYTDFCCLFDLQYIKLEQVPCHAVSEEQKNKSQSLHSPININDNLADNSINCLNNKPTSIMCHSITSSDSDNNTSSHSVLSPTIAKALIDRFVKDPIKFYGGKDNVTTWLDEIEQQFKIMNLNNLDKLNLIHICLKGEAYQWYKQYKTQFVSWSIFVSEITKAFTSHLQRDLAFKKLKMFHQTLHQSVIQYYTEMIKLIQQADPQMNDSTKIQHLMNGLRPSLSTETRRNYPKSTQDFLEQAKIAEELTAINTTFASTSMINDDLTPSTSSSYRKTNDFTDYSNNSNIDHNYNNNNYSSNNNDQHHYLNRIYKSSSSNSYDRNQPSHSSRQTPNVKSTSNYPPSLLDDNTYRNNNSKQQQNQQQFQRCFNCGSLDHIARHCNRFEKRSQ